MSARTVERHASSTFVKQKLYSATIENRRVRAVIIWMTADQSWRRSDSAGAARVSTSEL
jgi:hypothetical protein